MNKTFISIIATFALGVLHTGIVLAAEDEQSQKSAPVPVQTYKVTSSAATFSQDLPGRVVAYRTSEVRARVDGIIEKRIFTEGQDVVEGEKLFQIDDRTLKALVSAAKADVSNAIAVRKLSRQTLDRYKTLLDQGAVSRQEYDTYAAQNEQSAAAVQQARARLRTAEIDLDYATVTAPISGRIGRALVTEGALVRGAASTHLATIEQIDKVYIDFTRSNADINKLRQIMSSNKEVKGASSDVVKVFYDDGTPFGKDGRLEFASIRVDAETGSVLLRAIVENPAKELLPGMYVRVKLPVAESENLLQVPQRAVQVTAQGAAVKIIKNGKLELLPVELGPMLEQNWIIKSGISEGQEVIVSDTQMLRPGTAVKADNSQK
ncbi:efflux RND transporter periplasmic adaptor subunit [Kangiella sp. TOML190]|uniref:efflux RND transporter periplasmic adaptor subunit n=1 Tax=Kangiella sp. TOML190 TaxID=2931351 RepID=UPI00203D63F8|nr:efflux RND transporter periplasmic adaptor subunit [Kangiella sp. TOML190]